MPVTTIIVKEASKRKNKDSKGFTWLFCVKDMNESFLQFTKEHGIVGIKGHRLVGGFRASLYNALPLSSVEVLAALMKEFAERKR